jgi:ParB-like chromosome segregation protein Spo0J
MLAATIDRGPQIYEGGLALSDVRTLPVADLSVGYSPREMKVDAGHVAALMEVVDLLPPVIVDHRTMTVIDGVHRLEAFRRVGRSHIDALIFNGKDSEAMVVAIQANVKHGKPLSRGERRAAARSLLHAFPERSDRWAGEVCGLSHTTVALIRRSLNIADTRVRTGRDGRRRPVDRLAGQMAVARVIADNPTTTVRQAAGAAGVAPSTVHRARARLFGCESSPPVPPVAAAPALQTPEPAQAVPTREEVKTGGLDLSSSTEPAEPASWLDRTAVSVEDVRAHLAHLPLSRVYEVVDECRRRARAWTEIADALEGRARNSPSSNRRP